MQDQTMELGLLLEAAHAQQTLAETSLERLTAHVRDLDDTAHPGGGAASVRE